MKKTPKRVLGILGLLLVVATTVFAVFLPDPSASAISSTVTDTIVVRVLSSKPKIEITDPATSVDIAHATQEVKFEYLYLSHIYVLLQYVDSDGNEHTITLKTYDTTLDFETGDDYGEGSLEIDFAAVSEGDPRGYGDYVVRFIGDGLDGVQCEDAVTFSYYPVTTTLDINEVTDEVYVDLDYNLEDEDIDYLIIRVYDEKGNLVSPLSPIKVPRGTTRTELPLIDYGVPSGKYKIETTAYDAEGEAIYLPYIMYLNYTAPASPDVPNTGGATTGGGLNISKTDYLITGMIIFFMAGFAGIYFIVRDKKSPRRKR